MGWVGLWYIPSLSPRKWPKKGGKENNIYLFKKKKKKELDEGVLLQSSLIYSALAVASGKFFGELL